MVTLLKTVLITRYLCTQCGYSEEWVDEEKDLARIEKAFRDDKGFNEFV